MLIENEDGTYTGGPLDVLCILHDVERGRFHAAFFEERPMPGPIPSIEDTRFVRLKSKMHHTVGAESIEGALSHLDELAAKIHVSSENVWREPREWDGDVGIVVIVPNWRNGIDRIAPRKP